MRLNQRDLCSAGGTHIIPAAESNTSWGPLRIKSNACSYPPQHFLILISFFPVTPNHLEHQSLTPSPIFHLHFFLSKGWRRQRTWAGVGRCWRTGWTGATSNGRSLLPVSFPSCCCCFLPVVMYPPSLPLPSSRCPPFTCVRVYPLAPSLLI